MKKILSIVIPIIVIAILAGIFAVLLKFDFQKYVPTTTTPESPESKSAEPVLRAEYPANLIEGKIVEINKKGAKTELTVEANIAKIFFNPPFDTKIITVSADEETKLFIYDMGKEKETPTTMASFEINDQVIMAVAESNRDIITGSLYNATKINKMVLAEQEETIKPEQSQLGLALIF